MRYRNLCSELLHRIRYDSEEPWLGFGSDDRSTTNATLGGTETSFQVRSFLGSRNVADFGVGVCP